MSKLLFDEHPLVILPELAVRIGLNEAIVLQQIHYWLLKSEHAIDGRTWVYNSVDEWSKQFPFFSASTVRRTLEKLEASGYLMTGCYNKLKMDKTKWYTIDYAMLESEQDSAFVNSAERSAQIEQMELPTLSKRLGLVEQMDAPNLSKAIPETTQKPSTETTTPTSDAGSDASPEMKLTNAGDLPWFIRAHWGTQGKVTQLILQNELMPALREIGLEEMATCIKLTAKAPHEKQGVGYLLGIIQKRMKLREAERVAKAMQDAESTAGVTSGMIHFLCDTCGREAQLPMVELMKHRGKTFACEGCDTRHSVDKYLEGRV